MAATRNLAKRATKADIDCLDCGMSGGPAGILAGKLTLMIGGDARVLRRAKQRKPRPDLIELGLRRAGI
jgi:3-hydroxyisobutyrate dehydrogenase-like beta-hydroxyacid dehydrogenase